MLSEKKADEFGGNGNNMFDDDLPLPSFYAVFGEGVATNQQPKKRKRNTSVPPPPKSEIVTGEEVSG